MDATDEEGYKPPPDFQENAKKSLIELSLTGSTEFWLIQWPINQPSDFDGQEVSLNLHHDGQLGSFEGSSGKPYDVVSYASQEPNAMVFLSSSSESKIVGKITRRVSLVRYPEPDELEEVNSNNLKNMSHGFPGTSLTNSSRRSATPSQGTNRRHSRTGSLSGRAASTHSSKHRSHLSETGEPSKASRKRHARDSIGSMDRSTIDTERGHQAVTSGSLGHSQKGKREMIKLEE